jgi:hypothetical protein
MTLRIDDYIWTIAEDNFIGKWVRKSGRLDHDRWLFEKLEELLPKDRRGIAL